MTRLEVVGFLSLSFLAGSVICEQIGAKQEARDFGIAALIVPTTVIAVEVLRDK
jgi:hypothetical protein